MQRAETIHPKAAQQPPKRVGEKRAIKTQRPKQIFASQWVSVVLESLSSLISSDVHSPDAGRPNPEPACGRRPPKCTMTSVDLGRAAFFDALRQVVSFGYGLGKKECASLVIY